MQDQKYVYSYAESAALNHVRFALDHMERSLKQAEKNHELRRLERYRKLTASLQRVAKEL